MKSRIGPGAFAAVAGITSLALSALSVAAQATLSTTTSTSQAAPRLSYGVPDVLALSQAKVNEDVIVTYIRNSSSSYGGLGASEIVYLRELGVSDRVVTTMLDKTRQLTDAAQVAAQQAGTAASATTEATTPTVVATLAAPCPQVCVPATVPCVRPAPTSTVYFMRDSRLLRSGYGYAGNYRYFGSGFDSLSSYSFGFGGGYRPGGNCGAGYRGGGSRNLVVIGSRYRR